MNVQSYPGSIRCRAALRRYVQENSAILALTDEREGFLSTISVAQPKVAEGEEAGEPITLNDVLYNGVKASIRVGNKFGSVSKVADKLAYINDKIAEHKEVREDCKRNLRKLLGSGADKAIRSALRKAA